MGVILIMHGGKSGKRTKKGTKLICCKRVI